MQKFRVKGKWLSRLPFVKELFEGRITEIEHQEVEVSEPEKAVKQLRRGVRRKNVNSRYIVAFLDVFKEKRTKLRKKIRSENNKEFRKRLRKELRALDKTITTVEQATNAAGASGDSGMTLKESRQRRAEAKPRGRTAGGDIARG